MNFLMPKKGILPMHCSANISPNGESRITSYNVCYTKLLRYCGGKAASLLRLPQVTGYIVAGLGLSPSLSGIIHPDQIEALFGFTSDMALAVIAYSIGGSMQMARISYNFV